MQPELIAGLPPPLPEGMRYEEAFLSPAEEASLVDTIAGMPLTEARYRAYTARRRTMSFGAGYDFDANALTAAPPIPPFLLPLRARAAAWAGVEPTAFAQALVTEYRPQTTLGWHRDVPQFGLVVGISLASACRMRLRPYPPPPDRRKGVIALTLEPRSIYALRGAARWRWQHSIPPTPQLRYSITLRTFRDEAA